MGRYVANTFGDSRCSCDDGPFFASTGTAIMIPVYSSLMVIVIGGGQPHSSLRMMVDASVFI
jgi:hypothetical protein